MNRSMTLRRCLALSLVCGTLAGVRIASADQAEAGSGPDAPENAAARLLRMFDADGDGKLNAEERAAARESSRSRRRISLSPQQLLERFDADGDGLLSEAERAAALDATKDDCCSSPSWAELLRRFDSDGDGTLDEEERAIAREALRAERRQRHRVRSQEQILQQFDTDGDGELSDEERARALESIRAGNVGGQSDAERRAERQRRTRRSYIERFDLDGDGELSDEEREQARVQMKVIQSLLKFDEDQSGSLSDEEEMLVLRAIVSGEDRGDLNGNGVVDQGDALIILERVQTMAEVRPD